MGLDVSGLILLCSYLQTPSNLDQMAVYGYIAYDNLKHVVASISASNLTGHDIIFGPCFHFASLPLHNLTRDLE